MSHIVTESLNEILIQVSLSIHVQIHICNYLSLSKHYGRNSCYRHVSLYIVHLDIEGLAWSWKCCTIVNRMRPWQAAQRQVFQNVPIKGDHLQPK